MYTIEYRGRYIHGYCDDRYFTVTGLFGQWSSLQAAKGAITKNINRGYLESYIGTALWSSTGANDEPLDDDYSIDDCSAAMKKESLVDIRNFIKLSGKLLDGLEMPQVMHDFWLTRNGHGAGFWDGDYDDDVGDELTKISESFGSVDLYVGDDGKILFS